MAVKKKSQPNFEDVVQTPSSKQLSDIAIPVNRAIELMQQIESLSETTKQLNIELYTLKSQTIPALLASAGTDLFRTEDGVVVTIAEVINGNLPKDEVRKAAALRWLTKNGGEGIIKGEITVPYAKGETKIAKSAIAALKAQDIEFTNEETVHFQTLHAFARELLAAGKKIPLELLGLTAGRAAKIVVPSQGRKEGTTTENI